MIEGVVNFALEATLTFDIQGSSGPPRPITAVIDTGFDGALTLPPWLVSELDLDFVTKTPVAMFDESRTWLETYGVTVHWDGRETALEAQVVDSMPYVGTELLAGHSLHVDFEPDGRVVVEARAA